MAEFNVSMEYALSALESTPGDSFPARYVHPFDYTKWAYSPWNRWKADIMIREDAERWLWDPEATGGHHLGLDNGVRCYWVKVNWPVHPPVSPPPADPVSDPEDPPAEPPTDPEQPGNN